MNHELMIMLTIVSAVGIGLIVQVVADRWRIPSIVLLLLCGVVVGQSALGIVQPTALGAGLSIIVKLAVAIILFEGALNLRLSALRNSIREVRNLVSLGVLITGALTALIAHYIANLEWPVAILFGALMTVTGPTVVQPLLKRINVTQKVKSVLEGEAILVDPIGAILAVAILDVIISLSGDYSVGVLSAIWSYFGRIVIGLIVGVSIALILSRLIKIPHLISAELSNLVVLAGVWFSFGIAEFIQSESGIMASVAMGLALQSEAVPGERQLRKFKGSLTTLSISVLFILLAANLEISAFVSEGMIAVISILLIMFVVRPVSVFFSTWKTTLNWREKVFIAWIAPRGIIAASVASLFWVTLKDIGISDAERLQTFTFLAIIMTIAIQGMTASKFAHFLKLHSMKGRKVVIIGASSLGRKIAEIIRKNGRPVMFIDTNQTLVMKAKKAEFEAVRGNALDKDFLEDVRVDEAESIVALTSNSEVNVLASQLAYEEVGIKYAFPAINDPEKGAGSKILEQTGGKLIFGKPIDVFSWEYADSREFVWEVPEKWAKKSIDLINISDDLLPIIRVRDESAEIVYAGQVWQPKDKIVFLTRTTMKHTEEHLKELFAEKETEE